MTHAPFHLWQPSQQTCNLVFSSPHSGAEYPDAFVSSSQLDPLTLRSSEDAYIQDLYRSVPNHGAPLIAARVPRAFVDLNRSEAEIDPALVQDSAVRKQSARVVSGLGVIPRVVAEGKVIRRGKMTRQEAQDRIDQFYRPYHNRLRLLLNETRAKFGTAILIDCHSMPHSATESMVVKGGRRPDIVLGDRYGAAAPQSFVDQVEDLFIDQGFSVARNVPFAGAYISQTYGRPSIGQFALQIEIDRAIYLDEAKVQKNAGYWDVKARIDRVIAGLCDANWQDFGIAAE
ncbi:MAG: N-formylglutamate amidohydrolase [Pseudomonadota bacterium]